MDTSQTSQAEPTTEEIKQWDEDELLGWIQQKRPKLLKGDDLKKLKEAHIPGRAFLIYAGEVEFFKTECNLPIETSVMLANLAREIAGGETTGIKSKLLSFIPYTPRRQQANNLTSKGRRGFQGRNQIQAPTCSCKNERRGLDVSATPGTIQDTCNERSRPLRPLQGESN